MDSSIESKNGSAPEADNAFQSALRAEYKAATEVIRGPYDDYAQRMAACSQNTPAGFFAFVRKQFSIDESGEPKGKIISDQTSVIENHSAAIKAVVNLVQEADSSGMSATEYTGKLMAIITDPALLDNDDDIETLKQVARGKDVIWLSYLMLYGKDREIANVFFQNAMQFLASAYSIRFRPNAAGTEEDPVILLIASPGKKVREIKVVELIENGQLTDAGIDFAKRVVATERQARMFKLEMQEKDPDSIPQHVIDHSHEVAKLVRETLLSMPPWRIPLYVGPNTLDFDSTLLGSENADGPLLAFYIRNYASMTNDGMSFFRADLKQVGYLDKRISQVLGEYHFSSFGLSTALMRVLQEKIGNYQFYAPQLGGLTYRTQFTWGPARNVTFLDPRIESNLKNLHDVTSEVNEHVVVEHDSYHGRSMWFTDDHYMDFRQATIDLIDRLEELGIENPEFFARARDEVFDNDVQIIFGGCPKPEYLIAFLIDRYLSDSFNIWNSRVSRFNNKLEPQHKNTAYKIAVALKDLNTEPDQIAQLEPIPALLLGKPTLEFLAFQIESQVNTSARLEEMARRVAATLSKPLGDVTTRDLYNHCQSSWKLPPNHVKHLPSILKWVVGPKSALENYKILTA